MKKLQNERPLESEATMGLVSKRPHMSFEVLGNLQMIADYYPKLSSVRIVAESQLNC